MEKTNGNIIYNSSKALHWCHSACLLQRSTPKYVSRVEQSRFLKRVYIFSCPKIAWSGREMKQKKWTAEHFKHFELLLHIDSSTCVKDKIIFTLLSVTQIALLFSKLKTSLEMCGIRYHNVVCFGYIKWLYNQRDRQSASCTSRNAWQKWLTVNTLELLDLPDWNVLGTHTMELYLYRWQRTPLGQDPPTLLGTVQENQRDLMSATCKAMLVFPSWKPQATWQTFLLLFNHALAKQTQIRVQSTEVWCDV